MQVDEAKDARTALEKNVLDALREYEERFGVVVSSVMLKHEYPIGVRIGPINEVEIAVQL